MNNGGPTKADLVLHQGVILGHPESDSIAVAAGRIVAHGRFAELKPLVGPRSHLIKLAGRTVAPGFIDSHLHFLAAASAAAGLSLARCRNISDLLSDLRVAAGGTPPGNWLRAFGCDEELLEERRGPTRRELDLAVPKNPLRLRHQTLHASWLNSRAIALLGIEQAGFKLPSGAQVVRDDSGEATGLMVGMEEWLGARLPLVTEAETEARARVLSRELASAGVTAFTDATARNGVTEVALFARLAARRVIVQHIGVMMGGANLDGAEEAAKLAAAAQVRLAGLKFMSASGAEGSPTARRVRIGLASGLDCAFHVTELEELEEALDLIALARTQLAGRETGAVARIEHGGVITAEHLTRLAALGAWVVTNPGFIHFRGAKYMAEPGLGEHLYPARSLKRAHVEIAGATDAPVTPPRPLAAIAAAVSRATLDGDVLGAEERLSTAEAFALFTHDAARLARLDAGVIAPQLSADLIVLARNPMELTPSELANLAVDITIIGGRVVYERGRPALAWSNSADLHTA